MAGLNLLINQLKIDWQSSQSHYFFNESHPESKQLAELAHKLPLFSSCIYLFTSSFKKICILKKESFLSSAQAVNRHLECSSKDKWNVCLPWFHVGGLSVLARSFYGNYPWSHSSCWNPHQWVEDIKLQQATLTSLVPTQVYDIIRLGLMPPPHLRAVVVGGDALSPKLYSKARELLWPLLPSYGMTESCSQIATASLKSLESTKYPQLKILDHINLRQKNINLPSSLKSENRSLQIKSPALLENYFDLQTQNLIDPKDPDGWFDLEDDLVQTDGYLFVKGTRGHQIKIKGELVDLQKLQHRLKKISFKFNADYEILSFKDERQSYDLCLVTTSFNLKQIFYVLDAFNDGILSYENIQKIYCLDKIKKTSLLKVKQEDLNAQIF